MVRRGDTVVPTRKCSFKRPDIVFMAFLSWEYGKLANLQ
jgi:hypothetical protein